MTTLKVLCLRALQNIITMIVRPYVVREFPGWGKVYATLVGDYKRDWLWVAASTKIMRGKVHGYVMHLNVSQWPDRSTYFLGRWHDLEMQLLQRDLIKQGDTIVDVGAHRGDFALVASRLVGDTGKVICFEPNPVCLKALDLEIASNRIKNILVHRVGLGDREEELKQNPFTLALSVPSVNPYGQVGEVEQVKVKIKKGDDLLKGQHPRLIKIDVEGFECNVIAGLADTINQHQPVIVTEIVQRHLAACGFSVEDLMGLMRRSGYEGYRLGLRRKGGSYTWELAHFDIKDQDYDAVWIHPSSNSDYVAVLNNHIRST